MISSFDRNKSINNRWVRVANKNCLSREPVALVCEQNHRGLRLSKNKRLPNTLARWRPAVTNLMDPLKTRPNAERLKDLLSLQTCQLPRLLLAIKLDFEAIKQLLITPDLKASELLRMKKQPLTK